MSNTEQYTQNMTSGNSMKQIILFFLPLLWGNLFQQLYSLVDSIIVGKGISDQALAAVGATGTLNFLILGFVVGMTRGFGITFAQSFGKGDYTLLSAYIRVAKKLSISFGLAFTIICIALLDKMLIFMKTPTDIFGDAYRYFFVILLGIVITVINNLEITILQSLGDSKTPLTAMICSSLVNIMLDIILIMAFNTGVAGAAVATVFSQFVSYLLCFKKLRHFTFLNLEKKSLETGMDEKNLLIELMKIGVPVALMNSVTAAGAMILQYFVNLMGSAYVAAYSACMKFASLFEQFGISVGLSMMTFVGQNKGAGRYDRVRKGVKQGLILSVLVNIPISMLLIFFPGRLAAMLLTDKLIISYCTEFMPIMGICFYALGWLFVYRYSVQGLGNTFVPMFSGGLEVIMRVIFGFALGGIGFKGIAVAEVSAWIGACIMLMVTYYILVSQHRSGQT